MELGYPTRRIERPQSASRIRYRSATTERKAVPTRPMSARASVDRSNGFQRRRITLSISSFNLTHNGESLKQSKDIDHEQNWAVLFKFITQQETSSYSFLNASKQLLRENIPDTVFIKPNGNIRAWYYTARQGHIRARHAAQLNWRTVREVFSGVMSKTSTGKLSAAVLHTGEWPIATARYRNGSLRYLNLRELNLLIKSINRFNQSTSPTDQLDHFPFCLQQYICPGQRIRFISIYTLTDGKEQCEVVAASPPTVNDEAPVSPNKFGQLLDGTTIHLIENFEMGRTKPTIQRLTSMLVNHINHQQIHAPILSKVLVEYTINASNHKLYLTAVLGLSWDQTNHLQLAHCNIPYPFQPDHQEGVSVNEIQDEAVEEDGEASLLYDEVATSKSSRVDRDSSEIRRLTQQLHSYKIGVMNNPAESVENIVKHAEVCNEEALDLKTKVVELERQLAVARTKSSRDERLTQAAIDLNKAQNEVQVYRNKAIEYEKKMTELEEKLHQSLKENERQRENFCSVLENYEQQNSSKAEELAKIKSVRESLETERLEYEQKLEKQSTVIAALEGALESTQSELNHKRKQIVHYQKTVEHLNLQAQAFHKLSYYSGTRATSKPKTKTKPKKLELFFHDKIQDLIPLDHHNTHDFKIQIHLIAERLHLHSVFFQHLFQKCINFQVFQGFEKRYHPKDKKGLTSFQFLEFGKMFGLLTDDNKKQMGIMLETIFRQTTEKRWNSSLQSILRKQPNQKIYCRAAGAIPNRVMNFQEFLEAIVRLAKYYYHQEHIYLADCLHEFTQHKLKLSSIATKTSSTDVKSPSAKQDKSSIPQSSRKMQPAASAVSSSITLATSSSQIEPSSTPSEFSFEDVGGTMFQVPAFAADEAEPEELQQTSGTEPSVELSDNSYTCSYESLNVQEEEILPLVQDTPFPFPELSNDSLDVDTPPTVSEN